MLGFLSSFRFFHAQVCCNLQAYQYALQVSVIWAHYGYFLQLFVKKCCIFAQKFAKNEQNAQPGTPKMYGMVAQWELPLGNSKSKFSVFALMKKFQHISDPH